MVRSFDTIIEFTTILPKVRAIRDALFAGSMPINGFYANYEKQPTIVLGGSSRFISERLTGSMSSEGRGYNGTKFERNPMPTQKKNKQ